MATDLCVFGPFNVPYDTPGNVKRIESKHKTQFWSGTRVKSLKLGNKRGCYVFALRAARGFVPWYVGRSSKGFEQETFATHKRDKYNRALSRPRRGTPVLFFVAPQGAKNMVPSKEIIHMESELIQFAVARNPDICNVQNTNNAPSWTIKGVIRSPKGKPSKKEKAFKTMLRI